MYRISLFTVVFAIFSTFTYAQDFNINEVQPPSWRPKFESEELELLVIGQQLGGVSEVVTDHPAVQVIFFSLPENDNYIYLNVKVSPVESHQEVHISFMGGREMESITWHLYPQEERSRGLSSSDYLYLITPDRFANGNPRNDRAEGMYEDTIIRSEPYARHGGDIEGVTDHLDYIESLGISGVWMSPFLENNEEHASYHGYAITNHYATDPRMGTNDDFRDLVEELHDRDMKIVMDMVYNHFGDKHHLFLDPPSKDWFNQWDRFTQTNYRATALMDPYASEHDKRLMSDGWFDKHMPDVNQRNPHVAKWLIQNSIWWIDEYGVDAFRIDTYAYSDQQFMATLDSVILHRHPDFFIFGETWVHHEPTQYWFLQDNADRAFNSHLQSVTDFQFYFALKEALTSATGWSSGLAKVYYVLSHDYLYNDPYRLVTFVDNHDEGRFYGMIGQDMRKYKMGVGLMLTTRGIPCLYYGTEILMRETDGHGKMRQDFPGGWKEDTINKFEKDELSAEELEAFEFTQYLGNLRRENEALSSGKLIQWAVKEGVYAFARDGEGRSFLILMNADEKEQVVNFENYDEVLDGHRQFEVHGSTDFKTGEVVHFENTLTLLPNTIHILQVSFEPYE